MTAPLLHPQCGLWANGIICTKELSQMQNPGSTSELLTQNLHLNEINVIHIHIKVWDALL